MNGRAWSPAAIVRLRELYADTPTKRIAKILKRRTSSCYTKAHALGLKKSPAQLAAMGFQIGSTAGLPYRFKPGIIPWNSGRKGWRSGGRSAEFYFKKGQVPANHMEIGMLRLNSGGYVDMKIRNAPGAHAWREFHVTLWEDAHGPVPKGHCLVFRDRDRLNICDENIELISRGDLMRRNSIHHLPPALKSAVNLLGKLKRRINREKQDRGSAGPSVRDAGRTA